LLKHLNCSDYNSLLELLGVDLWHFSPRYIGPKQFTETNFMGVEDIKKDYFGISWKPIKTKYAKYYEIESYPLINIKDVDEIEKYPWPRIDWFDSCYIKEEIKKLGGNGKKAIVLYAGGAFEIAWYMRSMERLFCDLLYNPQIAEAIFKKLAGFFKNRTMQAIEILKGKVDIIYSDGDIGTQNGMMISPAIWRKYIKPWSEELIKPFKKMGFKTMYHSCGSIIPVIDDFIEMGLDILDPVQTSAKDMNPEYLKEHFGERLSFHGGVDEQKLLPYSNDSEVEIEVSRLIDVLGKNGGYILSSSHAIQPDTPLENILAMYRAAKNYKY
jgi:uroporphyrinogen decarboxylase